MVILRKLMLIVSKVKSKTKKMTAAEIVMSLKVKNIFTLVNWNLVKYPAPVLNFINDKLSVLSTKWDMEHYSMKRSMQFQSEVQKSFARKKVSSPKVAFRKDRQIGRSSDIRLQSIPLGKPL